MANTTNYNLNKPAKGTQNWDTLINANMDTIDSTMKTHEDEIGILSDAMYNVKMYSLIGNGIIDDYTALKALITRIGSNKAEILLPAGTYIIGTNITIPSNICLNFICGAILSPNSGVTITINGSVKTGLYQIFSGSGSVVGIGTVYPEWWGAKPDNSTDCSNAFDSAYNCISQAYNQNRIIYLARGWYILTKTWNITPTADNNIKIIGSGSSIGTRLRSGNTFTGSTLIQLHGSITDYLRVANFELKDFTIDYLNVSVAPSYGLTIGTEDSSKQLIGLQNSLISNISSAMKNGFKIVNARNFTMMRCSAWNSEINDSIGCEIVTNGLFCGDFTLSDCQFVPNISSGKSISIYSANGGNNGIHGIRFDNCVFYKGSTSVVIQSHSTSNVGDIWFDKCAFDGFIQHCITIDVYDSNTVINDIQILDCYAQGLTSDAFIFTEHDSGKILNITIKGGWYAKVSGAVWSFSGGEGIIISNVNLYGILNTTGGYAFFNNIKNLVYTGNTIKQDTETTAYMIDIRGTSDYFIITNNISNNITSSLVSDSSTGTHKVITNNI
jgi:hypothetical protein